MNAFLEFLPTVGLAMLDNLWRGYPDTVLAEKLLMHCWKTFLVASLGGPIVVPPSDPREGVIGPLHTNTINKLGRETSPGGTACAGRILVARGGTLRHNH